MPKLVLMQDLVLLGKTKRKSAKGYRILIEKCAFVIRALLSILRKLFFLNRTIPTSLVKRINVSGIAVNAGCSTVLARTRITCLCALNIVLITPGTNGFVTKMYSGVVFVRCVMRRGGRGGCFSKSDTLL